MLTKYIVIRVSKHDVPTREELNNLLRELPEFDSAVCSSEIGKRRFFLHWHVLIHTSIPVDIPPWRFRQIFGPNTYVQRRPPNHRQTTRDYLTKVINYIKDDGDWWELSPEEYLPLGV